MLWGWEEGNKGWLKGPNCGDVCARLTPAGCRMVVVGRRFGQPTSQSLKERRPAWRSVVGESGGGKRRAHGPSHAHCGSRKEVLWRGRSGNRQRTPSLALTSAPFSTRRLAATDWFSHAAKYSGVQPCTSVAPRNPGCRRMWGRG
eukprot:scaffold2567_cov108-Isochrysis_galbana.AAC.2